MRFVRLAGAFAIAMGVALVGVTPASAVPRAIAKPSTPLAPRAIGADTAITVTWAAPHSDGGSPITGYTVTFTPGPKFCKTNAVRSCTMAGLRNAREYTITVQAANKTGLGSPSAPIQATPNQKQNCSYLGPFANLQGCTIASRNLANFDLAHANMAGANLHGDVLQGAMLYGVNLDGADMVGVNLDHAGLINALLEGADLETARLTGANLAGAYLETAELNGVSSGDVKGIPGALPVGWTLVRGYLMGPVAGLVGAQLSGVDLPLANLFGADLTGANLDGAHLGGELVEANFSDALLSHANLAGAELNSSNFTNANLTDASLFGTLLDGANFSDANLTGASLTNAEMDAPDPIWANTTCPDGTNSNDDGDTCANNFVLPGP